MISREFLPVPFEEASDDSVCAAAVCVRMQVGSGFIVFRGSGGAPFSQLG